MDEFADLIRRISKLEADAVDSRLFDERTRNLREAVERVEKRQEASSNMLKTAMIAVICNLLVTVIGGVILTAVLH